MPAGVLTDLSGKSRGWLTKKLNEIELPGTDSRDFDDEHIKQILLFEASDLYYDSRDEAKKKDTATKKNTKVASLRSSKDKKFNGHTGRA